MEGKDMNSYTKIINAIGQCGPLDVHVSYLGAYGRYYK
jgi:hypothetical protein